MKIMCNFELKKKDVEDKFGIHFDEVFAYELGKMKPYIHHDLVELYPDRLVVLPKGKIFVRAVAMQFDRYLRGSHHCGVQPRRSRQRPDASLYQCRHESVQGRLPRIRSSPL